MFDKNSALVQVYVRLLQTGTYNMDMVPKIGNLQEAVHDAVHETSEK